MRFDQSQVLSPGYLIPPASISADNTPAALDIGKHDACTILVCVGVGGITFSGTNKVEFKLTHSDDNSTYADVAQADVVGVTVGSGGIIRSLIEAHAAATVVECGYKGGKRYLKCLADFSGTHGTATPISVLAVRGLPLTAPTA